MIATLESDSIGYTPNDAFGKCSLAYVPKLFSDDFLHLVSNTTLSIQPLHIQQHVHKVYLGPFNNMTLHGTSFLLPS